MERKGSRALVLRTLQHTSQKKKIVIIQENTRAVENLNETL